MCRILFIFASCLIFFVQGCSSESSPQNFTPKNGGFSVAFPQAPKVDKLPSTENGSNINTYIADVNDRVFVVHRMTMKKEFLQKYTGDQVMLLLKEAGGKSNKAKVIHERDFELQGKLAKDVIYLSSGGGQQRVQWVLHNGRIFSIFVTATNVDLKTDQQTLNFLSSFRLLDFDDGWW